MIRFRTRRWISAVAALSIGAVQASAAAAPVDLSVMTYNIHGLPWPVALGRDADFKRIAARLRAMRKGGSQPHVVVLQEAFTPAAKAIGRASGYPFSANGPAAVEANNQPLSATDRTFTAGASWFKGERSGKLVDSGLEILSDYPIVGVRRMAFPAFACAGYDCLANKGVLMVALAVPGSPAPLVVATAHFNARANSGVADERSNYAYARQVDAAGAFLAESPWRRYPIIFAGDFNVGKSLPRRTYLAAAAAHWWAEWRRGPVRDAMHSCHGRPGRFPGAAEESFARAKDWQFFASTRLAALGADAIAVPFGRAADGSMLSDHFGYTVRYRLSWNTVTTRLR